MCCQRQKRNSSWKQSNKKMVATLVRHEYSGIMEREGTESGCQYCVEAPAETCHEVAEMQNEAY